MKRKLVSVRYQSGEQYRFLEGEYISESDLELKIKGLKDGTLFTIGKRFIMERQDWEEGDHNA